MGTKAQKTVAGYERLLRAVGRCCGHVVNHDTLVRNLLKNDRKMNNAYVQDDRIDGDALLHDLRLLAEYGWLGFNTATGARERSGFINEGAPATWGVFLKTEGLEHLVQLEKSWIRRAYEKNQPAWWMVVLTLVSIAVTIIVLLSK